MQLNDAGVLRHLLKDHGGMGVHEMARDGIASMDGMGHMCAPKTRPRQEPRDFLFSIFFHPPADG